jgi:hypothetical protein
VRGDPKISKVYASVQRELVCGRSRIITNIFGQLRSSSRTFPTRFYVPREWPEEGASRTVSIMKRVVHGIASSVPQVNEIIEELRSRGFPDSEISVLFPDRRDVPDAAVADTKAPAGAAAGGIAGLGVGGAFGLLAAFGAFRIPGVGPLVAIGPLVAALSAPRSEEPRAESLVGSSGSAREVSDGTPYTQAPRSQSAKNPDLGAQRRSQRALLCAQDSGARGRAPARRAHVQVMISR